MEKKYLVLLTDSSNITWLGEYDTLGIAQDALDEHCRVNTNVEAGWVVETVGSNYTNT